MPLLHYDAGEHLVTEAIQNRQGLTLTSYTWPCSEPKAIALFVHGLGSHSRYQLLAHVDGKPSSNNGDIPTATTTTTTSSGCRGPAPRCLTYDGSWAQAFNQANITVCGLDLQGHGASEAWRNSRCNVECFDDFAFDVLQFATRLGKNSAASFCVSNDTRKQRGRPLPLVLLGTSMGGGIVARTAQLYQAIRRLKKVPRPNHHMQLSTMNTATTVVEDDPPVMTAADVCEYVDLAGCVMMCPNFLLPMMTSWPAKTLLPSVVRLASAWFPTANVTPHRAVADEGWVDLDRQHDDPLFGVFTGRLPLRIVHENIRFGDGMFSDIALLMNAPFSMLLVHANYDTVTCPSGSKKFYNLLQGNVDDIALWLLEDMGHLLTLEPPGHERLRQRLIEWVGTRLGQRA